MPPVQHVFASSAGWTESGAGAAFEIVINTPSSVKVGDTVIAMIVLTSASAMALDAGSEWTTDFAHQGADDNIVIARYVIDGEEGVTLPVLGFNQDPSDVYVMTIVKRGLAIGAAAYGAAQAVVAASTDWPCPSQTLGEYSGLYLGLCDNQNGAAAGFVPPAGATELLDFGAGGVRRFSVFEILPEAAGATGVKTATSDSGNGHAVSIAYAATPTPRAQGLVPDVAGAIGFVTVGV